MDDEVIYMLNRFPKHKKLIMDSYDNNEEFKSMCRDLYTSAKTLEKFEMNLMKNLKGQQEYERVFADLEKEIVQYLSSTNKRKRI